MRCRTVRILRIRSGSGMISILYRAGITVSAQQPARAIAFLWRDGGCVYMAVFGGDAVMLLVLQKAGKVSRRLLSANEGNPLVIA